MTIDEARAWLQRHADNTPMPGVREAYQTILDALGGENCQGGKMNVETAIRLLRFERSERYPELPGFLKMRDAMEMAINALERTRWIPVEERLPEKQGWYHVIILDTKTKRKVVEQDLFAIELAEKYGHNAGFCKDGRWEGRDKVVMWMPFPELPEVEP